jgi:hypothetical protein
VVAKVDEGLAMKINVETVAVEKPSGQSTPIEVLLDIDEQALARVLGARAFKSSRKMTQAMKGMIRASIRVLPRPAVAAA